MRGAESKHKGKLSLLEIKQKEINLTELSMTRYKKYIEKLDDWALKDAIVKADSIIYMPETKKKT